MGTWLYLLYLRNRLALTAEQCKGVFVCQIFVSYFSENVLSHCIIQLIRCEVSPGLSRPVIARTTRLSCCCRFYVSYNKAEAFVLNV